MPTGTNGDLSHPGSEHTGPFPNVISNPCRQDISPSRSFRPRHSSGRSQCQAQKIKQVSRNIYLYKKSDWDQLKESMRDFHKVLKSDLATADIQILWDEFVTKLQQGIDTFIPIRKAKSRIGLPWINQEIRRLMRRRDKRWIRSCRADLKNISVSPYPTLFLWYGVGRKIIFLTSKISSYTLNCFVNTVVLI